MLMFEGVRFNNNSLVSTREVGLYFFRATIPAINKSPPSRQDVDGISREDCLIAIQIEMKRGTCR